VDVEEIVAADEQGFIGGSTYSESVEWRPKTMEVEGDEDDVTGILENILFFLNCENEMFLDMNPSL
jgi:hypothetical protein